MAVPSSPSHCRPLCLQFVKEESEVIVAEKTLVDERIANLVALKFAIDLTSVTIVYQMFPTMSNLLMLLLKQIQLTNTIFAV